MNMLSLSTIRHMIIGVLVMMIMAVASVFALSNNNTSVSLAIVNSYSGTLLLLSHSGTWLIDTDDRWWTNQSQARLQVSSDNSSYLLSGDMI